MPRFSLFMATKERHSFVSTAVWSVLSQDYADWELIVEDGGRNSVYGLLPPDPRIIYIHDRRSRNLPQALNVATRIAIGDIFHRCDDDDQMCPGTLRWVAENIGDAPWLYGRMLWNGEPNGRETCYAELQTCNPIPCPAVFYTRQAALEVGGYDESLDCAEDYDYWLRLMRRFRPAYTDRIMAIYGDHPGQATKTRAAESAAFARRIQQQHRGARAAYE